MSELGRRLVHASGAVFPLAHLLGLVTWPQLRLLYVAGTALAALLEALRLLAGVDWWLFRRLTREYERNNPAGYALYVVGSTAVVLAFRPAIAIPAVLILTLVDPVSGLLGSNEVGDVKRPFVLAVTFLLSAAIAVAFVPLLPALLGALVATVADGVKPVVAGYVIDDNLTIPIGSAAAMWAGALFLPTLVF